MKVMKFGGTSVKNAANIKKALDIILHPQNQYQEIIVVVSALGGVTDKLIELANLASVSNDQMESNVGLNELREQHLAVVNELVTGPAAQICAELIEPIFAELSNYLRGVHLLGELSARSNDAIVSAGERLSSVIIAEAIKSRGTVCTHADARDLIKTDSNFTHANVNRKLTYNQIRKYSQTNPGLNVMGGFISSNIVGATTTLGRGGSDYTASLVGAALHASVIEIWTDVSGVLTADPRVVNSAFPLKSITYEEAGELSHFGAKVIHPKTMCPAEEKAIPIHIKNTFSPQDAGTVIERDPDQTIHPIKAISVLDHVALLRIQTDNGKSAGAMTAKLFDLLNHEDIEVLLTSQASAEQSISIAVHDKAIKKVEEVYREIFELEIQSGHVSPLSIEKDLAILTIVGKNMKGVPGMSGRFFGTLGQNKINVIAIAQGSSEINISAVISSDKIKEAQNCVHDAFFDSQKKPVTGAEKSVREHMDKNIFLIGTGLIGKKLIEQIKELPSPPPVVGIMNSRKMILRNKPIPLDNWPAHLAHGRDANLLEFKSFIKTHTAREKVLVDCTASAQMSALYRELLAMGVHVVTPNKKLILHRGANIARLKRREAAMALNFCMKQMLVRVCQ